jgi:hypothetical protein
MKLLLINLVAITHLRIGGRTLTPPPNTDRGRADRYIQIFDISAAKAVVAAKQMQPAFDHDAQALTKAGVPCDSFYGAKGATEPHTEPDEKPEELHERGWRTESQIEQRESEPKKEAAKATRKPARNNDSK